MAQFPGMRLTVEGNKMILRSASGRETEQLKITKAVLGDGQLTGNVDTLKSLVNPKLEVTISDEEIKDDTCIYHFLFDNKNVNQGFYWREIGLYGKNGNSGEEKLIAYSNANGLTSYIQDKTQPIPMQRLKIALAVGDNSNVQAVIDTSNAVDLGRVLKEVGRHNEDANVHSALMSAHNADKNAHEVITDVIKALKGTRAFDASVSKSVTEIITLLGMGGIVAAKLDANAGFVKFANGFIIQWIENESVVAYDYKKYELTFPIAFGANCIGAWISIGNSVPVSGVEVFYFDKKSTTGITLIADSSHAQATVDRVVCLALGF